ncbi:hypothetical protein [Hymenobacter sp. YC55]|uniref:hypothetical protein n=1 Tax=Hymenobacter sp. YC55 TaxID=3034019 RepID=UPI0023F89F6C|nr:hypothetical protein [Hymenobacter sp. YC55]MDF7810253.1 hypothetical protein [Hymenobacter sp. YC55]
MFKRLFTGVALLTLLTSCEKDPDPIIQLEGTYETSNTIVPGPIQLYTMGGRRITDQQVIKSFIKRRRAEEYFLFGNQTIPDSSSIEVQFQPAGKVILSFKQPNQNAKVVETEITARTQEQLTLTTLAESRFFKTTDGPSNHCTELGDKIKTVYPELNWQAVSSASGYSGSYCTGRETRVLTLKNGKPVLTLLSWAVLAYGNFGGCSSAYNNEWNTFNTALPAQLGSKDTVMVQTKEIALLKK